MPQHVEILSDFHVQIYATGTDRGKSCSGTGAVPNCCDSYLKLQRAAMGATQHIPSYGVDCGVVLQDSLEWMSGLEVCIAFVVPPFRVGERQGSMP